MLIFVYSNLFVHGKMTLLFHCLYKLCIVLQKLVAHLVYKYTVQGWIQDFQKGGAHLDYIE